MMLKLLPCLRTSILYAIMHVQYLRRGTRIPPKRYFSTSSEVLDIQRGANGRSLNDAKAYLFFLDDNYFFPLLIM